MPRLILFVFVAVPLFFAWAAYHAFIKKDFGKIKGDFYAGLFFVSVAVGVFFLLL